MKVPAKDNTYALLALFLSPWKDAETLGALAESIRQANVDWESVLYVANVHLCTPLWLVRLRKDGLLPLLPSDLQAYLVHLHRANVERNDAFRNTGMEIVYGLRDLDIPVILLKGAATFCDDLYGDPGARMMVDIDVLVKPEHAEPVQEWLLRSGYYEPPDERGSSGYFDAYSPHHLPRLLRPGTPVAVEVHFRTARGQAGRVLPTDLSWKHCQAENWEGLTPLVLVPSYRVLHNAVHALVPAANFINATVSLAQLAEFAHLVLRYGSIIDWSEWLRRGTSQGLGMQFRAYLSLANRLMAVPSPRELPMVHSPTMHVARISVAANYRACLYGCQNLPQSKVERARWFGIGVYVFLYSRLARPAWVWHNLCYKESTWSIPIRVLGLFAFFIKGADLRKALHTRCLHRLLGKMMILLKNPRPSAEI